MNQRINAGMENERKSMCPVVKNPYKDCYCADLSNQEKVKQAIFYCGEHFSQCEIYKTHVEEDSDSGNSP